MASHPETSTDPVSGIYLTTVEYHNRIYQHYAISNDIYHAPIDEEEETRLHQMHNVLQMIFNGRLILAPMNRFRRVLDCGFGSAAWACAVADLHPTTEVIGVDITASMQPVEVPDNLYLQIDDLNRVLSFPSNNFDLVNSQMLSSSIDAERWPNYMRELLRVTRPGGWCQLVEVYFNVQSDNGSLGPDHALSQWTSLYRESLGDVKDLRVALRLPTLMREAGFVDVESKTLQFPTCGWPSAQHEHDIGVANRENVQSFLSSLALYPMTERLRIAVQNVHFLIARARLEADDPAFKAYFPLYVCIGRKSRRRRT